MSWQPRRAGFLGKLVALSVVVGAIAGFGAIGFHWLLEGCSFLFLEQIAGVHLMGPAGEPPLFPPSEVDRPQWLVIVVPTLGGLLSGLLVYGLAPEAAGHGTDAAIDAYHHKGGRVRGRVPFVKAITAAITIGSGGSAGREGPIAQIGSGFGSWIAGTLGLSRRERRTLMAAGMAAGIGAIFHAPLAGALFAAEVLYREMDLEHEVLVPAFIASIVSYSVFAVKFGWSPVFATSNTSFQDPKELVTYALLALVVAAGAVLYIKVFYFSHHRFARWNIPRFLKPTLGGLGVGIIAFSWPETLGAGYGVLQTAFLDPQSLGMGVLLGFALVKIVTTALSIGSGGSGGVFGPAIVIGGALGGSVGLCAQQWIPTLAPEPGACVLVGMAGFFAAAASCPISTLIMVSEMTGNYRLLVPSMLVCVLAYLLTRRWTLYENQLRSRLEAPSKMGNMLGAVLKRITVREALARVGPDGALSTFSEGTNLNEMLDAYRHSDQNLFPVLRADGELAGIVEGQDIRKAIGEEAVATLVIARDLARSPLTISIDDTLFDAVVTMNAAQRDRVLVTDQSPQGALAVLEHRNVLDAYDRTLLESRQDEGEE